jgi:hypothetical protein
MALLTNYTGQAAKYMIQHGADPVATEKRFKEFFNQWRMNAIDNDVPGYESATSSLVTSISDLFASGIEGAGTMAAVPHEENGKDYSTFQGAKANVLARYQATKSGAAMQNGDYLTAFTTMFTDAESFAETYRYNEAATGYIVREIGRRLGAGTKSKVEETLRKNPALAETFLFGDLPAGFGSALGFITAGAATGGVGTIGLGVTSQAASGYNAATEAGLDADGRRIQTYVQAAIGSLEGLGLGGVGGKIFQATPVGKMVASTVGKYVETGLGRAIFSGFGETAQELSSQFLVDLSEKVGGVDPDRVLLDPEKMMRTAGVAFLTGAAMHGMERSDKVIMMKAQRAMNTITIETASQILDGSHPAVRHMNRMLASASDEVVAEEGRKMLSEWQGNARALLEAATENDAHISDAARVEGLKPDLSEVTSDKDAEVDETAPPKHVLTGIMEDADVITLRDSDEEAFRKQWSVIPPAKRTEIRTALGVDGKAGVGKVFAAFQAQTKDVAVEPDLETLALTDLVNYYDRLDDRRGIARSEVTIYGTEQELIDVTMAASSDGMVAALDAATAPMREGTERTTESLLAEFQVFGSNWTEVRDGIKKAVIALRKGSRPDHLVREKSQEWVKRGLADGNVTMEDLRAWRASLEKFAGAESSHLATPEGMVEWFSDAALDYLVGKSVETKTMPKSVREFLTMLAAWSKEIMHRAIGLQKAIAGGAVAPRFESALAQSSGLQTGATFNPYAGLTNDEAGQLAKLLPLTPEKADAYLRKNPDTPDAVITAYAENLRRSKAPTSVGPTLSVGDKKSDQVMPMSSINLLHGPTERVKRSHQNAAVHLKEQAIEYWGEIITAATITPEQLEEITVNALLEVETELAASGKNAANWYTSSVRDAMAIAAVVHPEMQSDEMAGEVFEGKARNAKMMFFLAMAITSQNLAVSMNTVCAEEQFAIFKSTGKFDPARKYGTKAPSISANLKLADQMLGLVGFDGLYNIIDKEDYKVRELEDLITDLTGKLVTIAGKPDDIVSGAAIFGPKIGQGFLQNLMGKFNPVTIDLWMRRTWGRWTGDVISDKITGRQAARLINSLNEAGMPLPKGLRKKVVNEVRTKAGKLKSPEVAEEDMTGLDVLQLQKDAKVLVQTWEKVYKLFRESRPPTQEEKDAFLAGEITPDQLERARFVAARITKDEIAALRNGTLPILELAARITKLQDKVLAKAQKARLAEGGKNAKKKLTKKEVFPLLDAAYNKEGRTEMMPMDLLRSKEKGGLKPEWAAAAKTMLPAIKDAPADADRRVISAIVNEVRERMLAKGVEVSNADIQAILWYPEKDLWAKLTDKKNSEKLKSSYDEELLKLADRRGLGTQAREARDRASRDSGNAVGRQDQDLRGETDRPTSPEGRGGTSGRSATSQGATRDGSLSTVSFAGRGETREQRNARGLAFRDALQRVRDEHKQGKAVTVKDLSFYLDPATSLFTSPDNTAGVAVTGDGDLVSVYKLPGSKADIRPILAEASQYANRLDAFDIGGFLPNLYAPHGFRPVCRVLFDLAEAGDWDVDALGTPDVVYMVRSEDPGPADKYDASTVPVVAYGDAIAVQDAAREDVQIKTGVGVTLSVGSRALEGMPIFANVVRVGATEETRVEFGPHMPARQAAIDYTASRGLTYTPPSRYVNVKKSRAIRIAAAFDEMESRPEDPAVAASYSAMIEETLAQYEFVKATGLKIEPIPAGAPDPYGNPRNAILDVVENGHLWFFPTSDGFGGPESAAFDVSKNPMLVETGEVINGHKMVANDVFRVVHDYFGHIKEGFGFRAAGEENAWQSHAAMYSPAALPAMTAETRGQNSWVNFGPHGEKNQTADGGTTEYAPQKVGLLPLWVQEEGREIGPTLSVGRGPLVETKASLESVRAARTALAEISREVAQDRNAVATSNGARGSLIKSGGMRPMVRSIKLADAQKLKAGGPAAAAVRLSMPNLTPAQETEIVNEVDAHEARIAKVKAKVADLRDQAEGSSAAPRLASLNKKLVASLTKSEKDLAKLERTSVLRVDLNYTPRQTLAARMRLIDHSNTLEKIIATLPRESRASLGGFGALIKSGTPFERLTKLQDRIERAYALVDKQAKRSLLNQIDDLMDKGLARKDHKNRDISTVGHVVTDELKLIAVELELDAEKAGEKIRGLDAEIALSQDDAVTQQKSEELLRVVRYGAPESKSVEDLVEIVDEITTMIGEGRLTRKILEADRKARVDAIRTTMVNTITGGKGLLNDSDAKREAAKQSSEDAKFAQFHANLISWEWLLNAASRADKATGTLGSALNEWGTRLVHRATHREANEVGNELNRLSEFLADIYGIDRSGSSEIAKAKWRHKVSVRHVEQTQEHDDTGVIKRTFEKGARYTKNIPIMQARGLANGKLTAVGLGLSADEESRILNALDAHNTIINGLRTTLASATDKDEIKRLEKRIATQEKKTTLTGVEFVNESMVTIEEMRLSQDQAINLSMMWMQDGVGQTMEYHGYSQETMDQIEEFLTSESLAIRDFLSERYETGYDEINQVYRRVYGASLPKVRHYSPLRFVSDRVKIDNLIDSNIPAGGSLSPGFLSGRIKHKAEPDTSVGALSLYTQHVAQAKHFTVWAEPMQELRSVLSHKDVQKAITQNASQQLNDAIQARLQYFADGGNRGAKQISYLDKIRRAHVIASLAYNWGVFFKQLTAFPGYLFDVPVKSFLKYQAKFWTDPKGNWDKMASLAYTQRRFESGYDRDIMATISGNIDRMVGGKQKPKSTLMAVVEFGMVTGRAGDIIPVIVGGYAAYMHGRDVALKRNPEATEQEIEDFAVEAFEMATDRNQQAGNIKDLSTFEQDGSIARVFTMYLTSPRQYLQSTWEAFGDMRAGRAGARKDFAKRLIIGHLILPTIFQLASDLIRAPFNDDDEEDFEWGDYLAATLLGPLNGIFLFGQGINSIAQAAMGNAGRGAELPILQSIESVARPLGDLWNMTEDGINLHDLTLAAHHTAQAAGRLSGNGTLIYDIMARTVRSFGLGDDIEAALFEPASVTKGKAADKRWDKLTEDVRKDPAKAQAKVEDLLKAGRITSDEARLLSEIAEDVEVTGTKPTLTKLEKSFQGMGTASGAKAQAMATELNRLPSGAREEQLRRWRAVGILSRSVEDQIEGLSN